MNVEVMTVEQALKILWDATESIQCNGPTRDALRLACNTLRISSQPKPPENE